MSWRGKIEQLVGLIEKSPQPKSFESKAGVYEPYFLIELRASNWTVLPYANYTRLDGSPGREVRLSLAVIDSSKVNITEDELNCLIYLQTSMGNDGRQVFTYTQPVGFLLDWLRHSTVLIKDMVQRHPEPVSFHPEAAAIVLRLKQGKTGFYLQPTLKFKESALELEHPVTVLTSNPIYILYNKVLYKIDSHLPAIFWNNYFRVYEKFEIPKSELDDFIRIYLSHLLPILDWENLADHLKAYELPLEEKAIVFTEENQHLQIEVFFRYRRFEFPANPPAEKSLTNDNGHLFIIRRDREEEDRARNFLEEHGLIYRSGYWHIAADYHPLDWMRLEVPRLEAFGFTVYGLDKLHYFRVHRGVPRIRVDVQSLEDWLELRFQIRVGNRSVIIPQLVRQLKSGKPYLKLSDGSHIYLPQDVREQILRVSEVVGIRDGHEKIRLPNAGVMVLQELEEILEDIHFDDASRELINRYKAFREIEPVPVPRGFRGQLRQYQKAGLDWLHFLHQFRFGGILADDMGLGKTVQVIALLTHLKEEGRLHRPALIVVPLTLIFNWWEEFQKFSPALRVLRYYGNRTDRVKMLEKFDQYDVILCSYGVVLQDQKHLSERVFEYVVLDESQKIKNPQTKTYRAVQKLKSMHRLALTGTPIENALQDLWAQFNFVNPGFLGTLPQFAARYVETSPEEREHALQTLRKLIYPFILRRTKEEVEKQLPPLSEIIQVVEMTDKQRRIYNQVLEAYRQQIFSQVDELGIQKVRMKIIEALTYLRQIACHPAILKPDVDLYQSGKILLLEDMLEEILGRGHKVLIFSQFVRFLALVRRLFEEKGWKYEYLDGRVRNRAKRIHNFQENPEVGAFLISLKAGGLGLNLTAADYVIHLDPWWNPAVEQQATDRAHRIGQDKGVFVYKYIIKDSVEEKIRLLQEAKRRLSRELITSDDRFIKQLTREDLEQIFEIQQGREASGSG